MQKAIDNGEFIESAHVHSNIYGTSKEAVTNVIDRFLICILDIDVQGVRNLLKYGGDLKPIYVFIAPPSIEELERRLRARATDSEETIKVRMMCI
jgi:guanylate kinase